MNFDTKSYLKSTRNHTAKHTVRKKGNIMKRKKQRERERERERERWLESEGGKRLILNIVLSNFKDLQVKFSSLLPRLKS